MRIRTQFLMAMFLFGIVMAAISTSAIITNYQIERVREQRDTAGNIARGASDLSYLSNDYVIYRESQQLERWRTGFASFSGDVAGLQADKPDEETLVRNIRLNTRRLKKVFDDVVSAVGKPSPDRDGTVDLELLKVSWSRMAVQSQALASDASRLSRLLTNQVRRLQRADTIVVIAMIGVFAAFFLVNYMMTQKRALEGIAKLQAGTAIIGSGNLDFSIEEKRDDEIGDLSRAFNRMAADLKAVTASKADLEQEMRNRRQAETAFKESEAKYKNLFENMAEEVHFWQVVRDDAGDIKTWRLVAVNPPALKSWGRKTVEDIRGQTSDEIFGPGATEHYMPVVRKIFTEGVPHSFEDYFPNLDKYFRFTSVPFGEFFIITGADITAIKKTEQTLRESEARFRLALKNAPVSVAAQDRDLRYIWTYNQRTARPEGIIGRFDQDIFIPEEAAHVTAIKQRVLKENIEIREKMWFNRPNG